MDGEKQDEEAEVKGTAAQPPNNFRIVLFILLYSASHLYTKFPLRSHRPKIVVTISHRSILISQICSAHCIYTYQYVDVCYTVLDGIGRERDRMILSCVELVVFELKYLPLFSTARLE